MPPVEDRTDRNDRERLKAIEMAVGQIEKQFGKGSIMRLGQKDAGYTIPAISTGSVSLDYALGIGGVPAGASSRSSGRSRPARRRWRCR